MLGSDARVYVMDFDRHAESVVRRRGAFSEAGEEKLVSSSATDVNLPLCELFLGDVPRKSHGPLPEESLVGICITDKADSVQRPAIVHFPRVISAGFEPTIDDVVVPDLVIASAKLDVIDSPLKNLDVGGLDKDNIKDNFFKYLIHASDSGQMIIIENTNNFTMTEELKEKANVIEFTHGTKEGRYGFLYDYHD